MTIENLELYGSCMLASYYAPINCKLHYPLHCKKWGLANWYVASVSGRLSERFQLAAITL